MGYSIFMTDPHEVEDLYMKSPEKPPRRSWESCSGDCVNLSSYELPDEIRKALEADPDQESISLAHYFIFNNDRDMVEDRMFLFINDEPVAVWIAKY